MEVTKRRREYIRGWTGKDTTNAVQTGPQAVGSGGLEEAGSSLGFHGRPDQGH